MKKIFKKIIVLFTMVTLIIPSFSGCTTAKKEGKKTVKIACVNWSDCIAVTYLAKAVLEDKMGYDVTINMADPGVVFTSVGEGDTDAYLDVWLPVTHKDYMDKVKGKVVKLGPVYENALLGLVVPSYTKINSIGELNTIKDNLKGKITGIDPGAGIMNATSKAIEEYNLDLELIEGSGPAMTTMLKDAIDKKEDIVVTGWKPHWKFGKWNLKFLEDPKKVYGTEESAYKIIRSGFEEDMPEVTKFLNNYKIDIKDLSDLMYDIYESDKKPLDVAKEWMNKHEDLVNSWIPEK